MLRTKIFNVITAGFIMGVGFLLAFADALTAGCGNILNIFRGCGGASNWDDLTFGWVGVVILFAGLLVFILSWTKLGNGPDNT